MRASVSPSATCPAALRDSIVRKSRESSRTQEDFIAAEAERIGACAAAMAEAFGRGGRLFVIGNGGSACDAEHVAVEFMHPILEKRPPLPALALCADSAFLTAIGNDQDFSLGFAKQIGLLAKRGDIALGISTSGKSANVNRALDAAADLGLLRVGFTGRDGGKLPERCDFCFIVPSFSIHRIQESHAVLLHVLWDAIHLVRGETDVL